MSEATDQTAAEMSDTAGATADTTDAGNASDAAAQQDDGGNSGNREQRLRQRAQTAEWLWAESTHKASALATQVEAFQRTEVHRIASGAGGLTDGADVFADGAELSTLIGDDGQVNAEAVTAAARSVGTNHPHYRKPSSAESTGTVRANGVVDGGPKKADWTTAFAPK